jgi:ubiquinone/menaquinone biosynthesis C-methylase UbiE
MAKNFPVKRRFYMAEKYNEIGKSYNQTRKADPRIVQGIIRELGLEKPAWLLDLGAGTGNYSYELALAGYNVVALEPSEVMASQGKNHENLQWRQGFAEAIPFPEGYFDGVICVLATHHFQDLQQSLEEMKRVLKENGSAIIFTADPRLCPAEFWYWEYFAAVMQKSYQIHPSAREFQEMLSGGFESPARLTPFPLPYDLQDGFFFSAWRYPERYLDPVFCRGISSLAETPAENLKECQEKLRCDLESGIWQERYGGILGKSECDCGYFFVSVRKT